MKISTKEFELIKSNANNLLRKGLIPQYAAREFTDLNKLKEALYNVKQEKYQYWSCKECGLGPFFGPRSWLRAHSKVCTKAENKLKEGSIIKSEFQGYRR